MDKFYHVDLVGVRCPGYKQDLLIVCNAFESVSELDIWKSKKLVSSKIEVLSSNI